MMDNDELAIRSLIAEWQIASEEGDIDRLNTMMSDDVIFLMPGQAPMRGKDSFIAAFREGMEHFRIESEGKIEELQVTDDVAYCWTHLSVTVTPHRNGLPMKRSGNTLTILRKQHDNQWVIVRDANMLTAQPANPS
jgi:uncharacterized protein (TIGR02246 family)